MVFCDCSKQAKVWSFVCVCSFVAFSFGCNLLCKKDFVVLVIFIASYKRGI